MNSNNLLLFTTLVTWISNKNTCWLCTVTETWGSSPRPVGSMMVFNNRGEQLGSVSGGCVEEDLINKIIGGHEYKPQYFTFGVSPEESEKFNLPCDGKLAILVERFEFDSLEYIKKINSNLMNQEIITRQVNFVTKENSLIEEKKEFSFICLDNQPEYLTHTISQLNQIFIIGASDVAQSVAELAIWMNYEVIICDPRAEKISQWLIKGCHLLEMMPDDGLDYYKNNKNLIVLALTHNPKIDDMGLLKAFDTNTFYIGAMGSIKTSRKRRDRLKALGVSEDNLDRLHAPVGLNIGSKTPREIAIAIMAELISFNSKIKIDS